MCEGLPAFQSTSIPILCTQRTDANLCSCHGDALLPLSILQALKPLHTSNTTSKSVSPKGNNSGKLLSSNGSKPSPPCVDGTHRGLVSIWFAQLNLNEQISGTGLRTLIILRCLHSGAHQGRAELRETISNCFYVSVD